MSTLVTILKDCWEWRSKIINLAQFDLTKQRRGAVLGWAWFFVKPLMYIFCFWFAIEIGLRAGRTAPGSAPFILWLSSGLIPWFFMQNILGAGLDVFHRYPYLVTKIKFPLSGIPHIFVLSNMIIQLLLQIVIVVLYVACGQGPDIHLIQVPFLLLLMYVFWYFVSLMFSPLCAMSKDVKNLMAALSTPFFWLSGILFDVRGIGIDWMQAILLFNPITFFATGFRDAIYDKAWVWEDPMMCAGFVIVFVATIVMSLVIYRKTNQGVADVL